MSPVRLMYMVHVKGGVIGKKCAVTLQYYKPNNEKYYYIWINNRIYQSMANTPHGLLWALLTFDKIENRRDDVPNIKEEDKWIKYDPDVIHPLTVQEEFALQTLEGDLIAFDAITDILKL